MSWRALGAGAIALVVLTVVWVGLDRPVGNGDEAIYAENVREMQRTGDWGVLTYHGEPAMLRPATPFVPVSWVHSVVGGERGLRLVPAVFCLIILGVVFAAARRVTGRFDVALAAPILCIAAPTFLLFSRSLMSDPALVAATTFALYATLRAQDDPRWLIAVAAGLGAGFAAKSLAAGIPGVALAPWVVVAIHRHRPWRVLAVAGAVFVALAAPYFVYSYARFGDAFIDQHLGLSLGKRAGGNTQVGMDGGVFAYALAVARNDGLGTVAWLALGIGGGAVFAVRERDAALGICVTFGAVVLVVLSALGTRLEHYILPVYPAAAVAAVGAAVHAAKHLRSLRPRVRGALGVALAATVLSMGVARSPEQLLLPSAHAVELGRQARDTLPPGAPVHTLDWYAPALGYYADRPWHLLSRAPRVTAHLQSVLIFGLAGNIHDAPPYPERPFYVAGEAEVLRAAGLRDLHVLGEAGPYWLARVGSE